MPILNLELKDADTESELMAVLNLESIDADSESESLDANYSESESMNVIPALIKEFYLQQNLYKQDYKLP